MAFCVREIVSLTFSWTWKGICEASVAFYKNELTIVFAFSEECTIAFELTRKLRKAISKTEACMDFFFGSVATLQYAAQPIFCYFSVISEFGKGLPVVIAIILERLLFHRLHLERPDCMQCIWRLISKH